MVDRFITCAYQTFMLLGGMLQQPVYINGHHLSKSKLDLKAFNYRIVS